MKSKISGDEGSGIPMSAGGRGFEGRRGSDTVHKNVE
jgi:hypothetical protein